PAAAAGHGRPKRTAAEWAQVVGGVCEGHRQEELVRVVGLLYAKHDPVLARELAHGYGRGCDPALTEAEVDACCDRIEAKELAKSDREADTSADEPGGERYTDMANAGRLALEATGKI